MDRSSASRSRRALSIDEPVSTDVSPQASKDKDGVGHFLKELPLLIGVALLVALLVKAFLVQAFYIQMQSMQPTLQPGDRVLVSKLSYRFGDPRRGDIVIFRDPRDPCDEVEERSEGCNVPLRRRALDWFGEIFGLPTSSRQDLVKRIIGLPGETIEILEGDVYVCDEPRCDPVSKDGTPKDGRLIDIPHTKDAGPQNDSESIGREVIGTDEYFVMGDNRDESSDSRTFGPIERDLIVGKAFFAVWPLSHIGAI